MRLKKVEFLFHYFPKIDSALNVLAFSYLFIKWLISTWIFGFFIYSLSLSFLLSAIMMVIIIDLYLFIKKRLFTIQLIISFLSSFIFSVILFVLISITIGAISILVIVFAVLLFFKIIRLVTIFKTYLNYKKSRITTKISFIQFKKKSPIFALFLFLLVFPLAVIAIGMESNGVYLINININNQLGLNGGSRQIQLSFYANLDSYDYLTNTTILQVLNGSDFGGDNLKPVEILLLVRENSLLDPLKARKLARIIQNCSISGLNVWTWFVYNASNGYYPSYEDYNHLPLFKNLFDEWVSNFSLNIHGILFDNEIDQFAASFSMDDIFNYLQGMINYRRTTKENWNKAISVYKNVMSQWKSQGYEIALIGMDMTLYDILDNDPDMQQLAGIINYPPNTWDRVSFMLYRHCEYHGAPYSQQYLYFLSRVNKKVFSNRAAVA